MPDEIIHEKFGMPEATRTRLDAMGYKFREREHIADAPGIGRSGNE